MKNEKLLISRAVLLGDKDAFGSLVTNYQAAVRRFLTNLTYGDRELADDLAQETFIKAWLNIRSFHSLSRFSTWLFRIAYNTFYDYTRKKRESLSTDLSAASDLRTGNESDPGRKMDISSAMRILNESERPAMLLFYMEDLSVEQISRVLKQPVGTVKSLLSRGRSKIWKFLNGDGYNS